MNLNQRTPLSTYIFLNELINCILFVFTAHKNTVAFLSHGGLLGTQEAMYHGIPIIGVPFGIDQMSNIDKIVHNGQGVKLSFKYVTADTLKKAILTVTNDKR